MKTYEERKSKSTLILIFSIISLLISIPIIVNDVSGFLFVLFFALGSIGAIRGIIGLSGLDKELYGRDVEIEQLRHVFALQEQDLCKENGKLTIALRWRDLTNNSFSAIRVFEENKTIMLKDSKYHFEDIISCELSDNNDVLMANTVTKTSTGSMIGRAVVGGVLLGGVGAVIGGATAKQETSTNTNTIPTYTLKITVNNLSNPVLSFKFIPTVIVLLDSNWKDIAANEYQVLVVSDELQKIASVLSVIIDRNKSNINAV